MLRKYDGSLLSASEKVILAARTTPSIHATMRIKERYPNINIAKEILESKLIYWSRDGYIIVAIHNEGSLVIDHNYRLVTVREPSNNKYSNADRWILTRWYTTVGRRY